MGCFVGKPSYLPIEFLVIIFDIVHVDFYGVSVLNFIGFFVVTIDVLKSSTPKTTGLSYNLWSYVDHE